MDIVVSISSAQKKSLETEIEDVQAWFQNWVLFRANEIMDKLLHAEMMRKLANGEIISGTKEDIILATPILSAAEKNALHKNIT